MLVLGIHGVDAHTDRRTTSPKIHNISTAGGAEKDHGLNTWVAMATVTLAFAMRENGWRRRRREGREEQEEMRTEKTRAENQRNFVLV